MPGKSPKRKGTNFEREIVSRAQYRNLSAKRSWGSDGRAQGLHPDVDVMVGGWKGQCKIRKRIAQWIKPSKDVDIQIIREDRGRALVVMDYEDFLDLLEDK